MKDDGVIVSGILGSISSFFQPYAQPANAQPANAQPANAQPENAQPENAQPANAQPENRSLASNCWRFACLGAGVAVSATAAFFAASLIISAVTTLAARVVVGGLIGAIFGFAQHHYAQHIAERVAANNGQNGAAVPNAAAGNHGTPLPARTVQQLPRADNTGTPPATPAVQPGLAAA